MFTKILIANRGEIACRVIKTARRMGIETVAVYSDADTHAQHVKQADQAVHIGAAASMDSYLNIDRIISAALQTGAQGIHPGYGFLSENAAFAQACADNGLVFIGPPVEAINAMGSKAAAKQIMEQAGVPLVPGYHGEDQDAAVLKRAADEMGYPVLLKAVAGGGGKGMRQVNSPDEFDDALATAKREATSSFGDDVMLVERYLLQPRHVEFQVFFDQQGHGVYLFERDCSVQRRHQKVIEEAPAPHVSNALRQQMGEAALQAAAAIGYEGAGTVEFLLDVDDTFYFMEMNTRLQVEHPVTEMITGEDLVEWQLLVAVGQPLPKQQDELAIHGHAFEARIYAEDPDHQFLPQTGMLEFFHPPQASSHVRVDTGVEQGDEISVHYDPMIAKLVCWDVDRTRALNRLSTALRDFHIAGVTTNTPFLHALATHPEFVDANLSTAFISAHEDTLWYQAGSEGVSERSSQKPPSLGEVMKLALYMAVFQEESLQQPQSEPVASQPHKSEPVASQPHNDPWRTLSAWRLNAPARLNVSLELDQKTYQVVVEHQAADSYQLSVNGESAIGQATCLGDTCELTFNGIQETVTVYFDGDKGKWFSSEGEWTFAVSKPDLGVNDEQAAVGDFRAPMNGTVVQVNVAANDRVSKGQVLVVMEAMKMEHAMQAPDDGVVSELFCEVGQLVDGGTALLAFEVDNEDKDKEDKDKEDKDKEDKNKVEEGANNV